MSSSSTPAQVSLKTITTTIIPLHKELFRFNSQDNNDVLSKHKNKKLP